MTIVVLEGPDGSGKSTLGRQLEASADLNVSYFHSSKPESVYDQSRIMDEIKSMITNRRTFIVDRAPWISDPIYAKVFNRHLFISNKEIIDHITDPNIRVVYCSPKGIKPSDVSLAKKSHKSQEYTAQVIAKHKRIIDAYDDLFGQVHKFHWMKYDHQLPWAFDDVIDFVKGA